MKSGKFQKKTALNLIFTSLVVVTGISVLVTVINIVASSRGSEPINPEEVNLVQIDTLKENIADDAEVAIIDTSYGEIRAELYPQYAPNTVANFKELVSSGYYNGSYFYDIRKGVYISGGSNHKDGSWDKLSKEEEAKEKLELELDKDLWPFKGAFMSMGGYTKNVFGEVKRQFGGSRFLIADTLDFEGEENFKEMMYEGKEDQDTRIEDAFIEYGGIPDASQQLTVFAQMYRGFDVMDKIFSVELDENFNPEEDAKIENIEICTYKESLEKKTEEK